MALYLSIWSFTFLISFQDIFPDSSIPCSLQSSHLRLFLNLSLSPRQFCISVDLFDLLPAESFQKYLSKFFYKTTRLIKYFYFFLCRSSSGSRSLCHHPCHSILMITSILKSLWWIKITFPLDLPPSSRDWWISFDFVILYYNISSNLSIVFWEFFLKFFIMIFLWFIVHFISLVFSSARGPE